MADLNAQSFQQQMSRIEELIQTLEKIPDAGIQQTARELVQAILDLHGSGLEAMLERIHHSNLSGQELIDLLAEDELVSHLFLLHGLHPLDVETRVQQALQKLGPYLQGQGMQIQAIEVSAEGKVQMRVESNGHLSAASAHELRTKVEKTIFEAVPDVTSVEILGLKPAEDLRVPLPILNLSVR